MSTPTNDERRPPISPSTKAQRRSIISVMPNASQLNAENVDIRVAEGNISSTSGTASSKVNLTFNVIRYDSSSGAQEGLNRGEDLNAPGASVVATLIGLVRSGFGFLASTPGKEKQRTPLTPAQPDSTQGCRGLAYANEIELMDIDQIHVTKRPTASHDVYVNTLLAKGLGLPCWEPRPSDPPNQPRGVVPGDVGMYTTEGGFQRVFNLWVDKARICDIEPTCGLHVACRGLNGAHRTISDYRRNKTVITHGVSAETPLNKQASTRSSASADILHEFTCLLAPGAILAMPTGADKEEAEDIIEMEEYIRVHAEGIYRHTNSLRRIGDDMALYIITGCIKSDAWAAAAYTEKNDYGQTSLQLVSILPSLETGGVAPEYQWTKQGMSEARWGTSSQNEFLSRVKGGETEKNDLGGRRSSDSGPGNSPHTPNRFGGVDNTSGGAEAGSSSSTGAHTVFRLDDHSDNTARQGS
ncbi:hypothetical protein FA13DRAFT_815757 [Coprinellus micaceus]|uniref:Uncharacterized protein n=1 Tax=Coprinellus micaceus TaxID=71717 RepID=A0A4Y7T2L8_COPMI|nr:hypothetical protein FA13DRAFT_815757 [Coprinellus micaceus]